MQITDRDFVINEIKIEVFDATIKEYVYRYFEVDDFFPEDEILRYVNGNYTPEEVFTQNELETWALHNNKKEEI